MRLRSLLLGDIRFQYRYGFYFLYMIFSVLYIGLLFAFPQAWREKAAIVMVFSDPAAMGLFFMGAIVLFEKSERVLDSMAVSSVRPIEYTFSKLVSIAFISVAVAIAILLFSQAMPITFYVVIGVFLCSCLFSAVGLVIAARSISLNGFILSTIPAQLVIAIPAMLYLFGWRRAWLLLHPGVCLMELCENGPYVLPAFAVLVFWTVAMGLYASGRVEIMLKTVGGVKL